jgi:diguanylate cyclase (GGDEF)-like protein
LQQAPYNLEFAMMHQAFLKLANFYNTLWENPEPQVNYTAHIANFAKGAHKLGVGGEEWELLSRTMIRLYRENDLLLRQSAVDRLTGLYHRDSLLPFVHTMAHLARRNHEAVAAVLIQVDDLPTLREEREPETANRLLRSIGRKLLTDIRKSDLVGRYTDDTFLVFLSQVDPSGLKQLGEMLHREAEAVARDLPATVSAAAACSTIREDVEHEVRLLLRHAEKLLADAKRQGSGQLVVQADYPRKNAVKKGA